MQKKRDQNITAKLIILYVIYLK